MSSTTQSRLVLASQPATSGSRGYLRFHTGSTSFDDLPGRRSKLKDVLRRVQIAVKNLTAFGACPVADTQREFGGGKPAAVAALGTGKEPVRNAELLPIPSAFVFEHLAEHTEAGAADVLCQRRMLDHTPDVQALDRDHVKLPHQTRSELVEGVLACVRNLGVAASHFQPGLLSAVATLGLLCKPPLQESKPGGTLHRVAGVGYPGSVAERSQAADTEVDPHFLPGLGQVQNGFIEREGHEVAASRGLDYRRRGWFACELSRPFYTKPSELGDGEVFVVRFPFETTGCVFGGLPVLLGLETWELSPLCKEIGVGRLQVSKRLLERDATHFPQKRELRKFLLSGKRSTASVVVDGLTVLIGISSEPQRRIVSHPDTAERLRQYPLLRLARVEPECVLDVQLHKRFIILVSESNNLFNTNQRGNSSPA